MSDAVGKTEALIESLGELSPLGAVLAETARALAENVDDPPTNERGVAQSIAPFANALRATVNELAAKGRASDSDAEDDEGDWAGIAAQHGATPIRDAPQPGPPDVRGGSRRGRSTAP